MQNVEFFKNSSMHLHAYKMNDGMWFALNDVLSALEVTRSDFKELEDDIRKYFNGDAWVEVINECGFWYLLLFESNNENANKFSDWLLRGLANDTESALQTMNTAIHSITEQVAI